ncbi:MAG: TMEM43 family protein [Lysobacterales bacterium]
MLDDVEIDSDDSADGDEGGSWFSRAKRGGRSLGAGAIFLASLALLFWNEGNSKRHTDALHEAADQVSEVTDTALNPALDGKPVHLSARVSSQEGVADPFFGIKTPGVSLYREVQMFQWIEYEETTGRGRKKKTTYYYDMDWDTEYHDSSQFEEPQGHENPRPDLVSEHFFAPDARFGPYRFDSEEVAEQAYNDNPNLPGSLGKWPAPVEQLPALPGSLAGKRWYRLDDATYYRGDKNSEEAAIGDLNVSFYALTNDFPLSLLAAQQGDRIVPYQAGNGDSILLAGAGTQDAATMVKAEERASAGRTSLFRTVGLIGSMIGAAGIASWLGGILTMIPIVGRLVSLSLMIAGALFGLVAGLTTIVVGWLSARPWVAALILIAIGSAVTWAIRKRREAQGKQQRASRAAELGARAREKAAQALGASPALAAAGVAGAMPPPPPPPPTAKPMARASANSSRPQQPAPMPPPPPAAEEESKELPPLEWTPGLLTTKPPAVRPRAETPPAAPAAAPEPVARAQAVTKPVPVVPAPPTRPLFDTVEARQPAPPLFDTVEARQPAAPLFDTVPTRETPPLFDTVEARAPAPVVEAPKPVRIALGSKGDYQLNKIVRKLADGGEQVICYELMKAGKPIKRGTQAEVKETLRQALGGG